MPTGPKTALRVGLLLDTNDVMTETTCFQSREMFVLELHSVPGEPSQSLKHDGHIHIMYGTWFGPRALQTGGKGCAGDPQLMGLKDIHGRQDGADHQPSWLARY